MHILNIHSYVLGYIYLYLNFIYILIGKMQSHLGWVRKNSYIIRKKTIVYVEEKKYQSDEITAIHKKKT